MRRSSYIYLNQLNTDDQNCHAYKNILQNFICAGIRVKDIESDTLRNIYAFGPKNAFLEDDKMLLSDWC